MFQGTPGEVGFTGVAGDTVDHTIVVTSAALGGGSLIPCSGPWAPGWNVSQVGGGCGVGVSLAAGQSVIVGGVAYSCPADFRQGCMIP